MDLAAKLILEVLDFGIVKKVITETGRRHGR
jgi:hypothetical protein